MADDFSTYEGRQAYRDTHPGAIVDASGAYYPSTGQTVTGGTPTGAAPTVSGAASSQLSSGINSLLGAIASGNKQAFDEAVRQFNATFGLDQSKFNEAVRQFNENLTISQAGLTGTFQGQQTQQAQQQAFNQAQAIAGMTGYWNAPGAPTAAGAAGTSPLARYQPGTVVRTNANQFGVVGAGGTLDLNPNNPAIYQAIQTPGAIQTVSDADFAAGQTVQAGLPAGGVPGQGTPTMAREQQTYAQQLGAIDAAAALQANPFRQAQVMGQLGGILGTGAPVAGFQAPNVVAGVGTAGGNTRGGMGYLQQMIDDIRDPTANQSSMQGVLDSIPTPNKIDSRSFLNASPSQQNLVLQGMQEKYGLDPTDALQQIRNTLPSFTAPSTFGSVRR